MEIQLDKGRLRETGAELFVVPVFEGAPILDIALKEFPEFSEVRVEALLKAQEFSGKPNTNAALAYLTEQASFDVLFVGLGERKGDVAEAVRSVMGTAITYAGRLGLKTVAVRLTRELCKVERIEAAAVAALLADYRFETFKKIKSNRRVKELDLVLEDTSAMARARKALERARIIADGVTVARDLVNLPAGDITPSRLAEAAQEIAVASGKSVGVKILSRAECQKLGMGSYLSVAQGSEEEPKFIHLTYTSPRVTKRTIGIAGKGVTFDSGGLSLKPADAMMTMKCDMAGAAAVLGFFATLSRLRPRVNIHGVIAATENMPSGKSTRPGDVVRAMNGTTIEVLNTDAEGRLTLADALLYLQKFSPEELIDLATLTGACLVALGENVAGYMTNDAELQKQVKEAAKNGGEKMWELPLEPSYRDLIISDVADLRNISTTRYGGTLTAGLFLQEFVNDVPWVHMDIAGPAFAERPLTTYLGKGGTGYGVRTLVEMMKRFA